MVWEGERARCVLTWQAPVAVTPERRRPSRRPVTAESWKAFSDFGYDALVEAGGSRLESVFTVERKER